MTTYTYLGADLVTGAILNELPLVGASFGQQLNGVGNLQAQLPLFAAVDTLGVNELLKASQPARTMLYVDRDGVIVWAGIIWTRRSQSATSRVLDIGALETWSIFRRRRLTKDVSVTATDQGTIVKTLLDHTQNKPGGNVNVTVPVVATGRLRDRTWWSYERKLIGEAVEQLSQVIDGFDFAIDTQYVNGVPSATFNLGYPRRGRTVGNTGLMFEMPGNILDYKLHEDGSQVANSVSGVGQGDGATKLVVTQTDVNQINAGYPLLEDLIAVGDIKQEATLDGHVLAEVGRRSTVPQAFTLHVDPRQDPVFGSWITGDDCRVRITDTRFPNTFDQFMRIVSWQMTPGDGDSPEQLTLILTPATSTTAATQIPGSAAKTQADIQRRLTTLETAPNADLMAVRDGAFVVLDSNGAVRVRLGKLSDGVNYGLEQVDTSVTPNTTVPLSAIALGMRGTAQQGPFSTSSTAFVDLGATTLTVAVPSTGRVEISASCEAYMPAGDGARLGVSMDGGAPVEIARASNSAGVGGLNAYGAVTGVALYTALTPGNHTFQLRFSTLLGNSTTFYTVSLIVRPY